MNRSDRRLMRKAKTTEVSVREEKGLVRLQLIVEGKVSAIGLSRENAKRLADELLLFANTIVGGEKCETCATTPALPGERWCQSCKDDQ